MEIFPEILCFFHILYPQKKIPMVNNIFSACGHCPLSTFSFQLA